MDRNTHVRLARRVFKPLSLAIVIAVTSTAAVSGSAGASSSTPPAQAAAKATAYVKPYLSPPTSIGVTAPIKQRPTPGKKIISVACNLQSCTLWRQYIAKAVAVLGWTTEGITTTGTPEDVLNKMEQAISEHPAAVLTNGLARSTWAAAIPMAAAAHVPIIEQMAGDTGTTKTVIADQYGAPEFNKLADETANYVISHGKGKVDALTVGYAQFPISELIASTMAKVINNACSGCKATKLLVQASDTGTTLPGLIVSAIQRDPNMNYVLLQDADMQLGVDAALKTAGLLGKVQVVGNNTTPAAIQSVVQGNELAWNAFSLPAAAFQGVDAVVRYYAHQPQVNAPLVTQIFTKGNLGSSPTSAVYSILPRTLVQQYKKLWLGK